MSLDFYPKPFPHDYIYFDALIDVPIGDFYVQGLPTYTVPHNYGKGWPFVLRTDNVDQTITIFVNDKVAKVVRPKSEYEIVYLKLLSAGGTMGTSNEVRVYAETEKPLYLHIVSTNYAAYYWAMAKQLYNIAGRTNERYANLILSPWATFFAEWLMPWRKILPDIRSSRIISTKMASNSLYGESGQRGAEKDFVSSFALSTPVITAPKNPAIWQPDLYQPLTASDDAVTYVFHTWFPNLCLARWGAFKKYINNISGYEIRNASEEKVVIEELGSERLSQHLFDTGGKLCSISGLLDQVGCLDTLIAVGSMAFEADVAICMFANPFDMTVEAPGIGSSAFLDSSSTFDTSTVGPPFDSIYDIDLLTDFWVGTPTSKTFDLGGCFDTYNDATARHDEVSCCHSGADIGVLTTARMDVTAASPVKPIHPLFGGDDPGLLYNPYFDALI